MTRPASEVSEPRGLQSIVSIALGEYVVLQRLNTVLECETCGRETLHQILYLGHRIAEVCCGECGRCVGMGKEDVVRAFVGEIVTQVMHLPEDVSREFRQGFSQAMIKVPQKIARRPILLAQDVARLLRLAWNAKEHRESLEAIFSQVDTTLVCTTCNAETPHRIHYLGRRVAGARCGTCGRTIGMTRETVFSDFVGETLLHLLHLPRQVRRELRADFSHAVQKLPWQMARMPFRVARDFVRLVRILRAPDRRRGGLPLR